MEPALYLRNVHKWFGSVHAVDGVSLEVYPGEIFGLLGPNGAGKTTTIRMIMHILIPDEGEIRVLGRPPGETRERVGYLPEERGLYPHLKVVDHLVYLAELKGRPRAWARERALHLLERVGLADRTEAKVRELSRGMQQKIQFLAAIIHDPELCIFDEPFQGLDPVNLQLIKDIIRDLQQAGKTIVLSTHQMNQVEALCSRIAMIDHGRRVLYGTLEEIKQAHSPSVVLVRIKGALPQLPGVARVAQ
ncbi:MAG: ATP-binding cassette domain-containing protein, partial [Chloroflexi bacterium]|nr:ATP-binding cassette domain-containing protein [Chloroflexota bacterium]